MRDLGSIRPKVSAHVSVLNFGPPRAPLADHLGAPPLGRFAPKPVRPHGPRRDHDVSVEVSLVALLAGRVHRDIGDHPARDEMVPDELADQLAALFEVKFVGQRHEHLTGGHGVLARVLLLGGIPQGPALHQSGWGIRRRHDLGVFDAVLGGEVELHRQALIDEADAGPVGRRGHGRTPRGTLDGLYLAKEGRQLVPYSPATSAGSLRAPALGSSSRPAAGRSGA